MIANNISVAAVRIFVVKYWFHLCLVGLAGFIFLRKDLSFSISFRAPMESRAAAAGLTSKPTAKNGDKQAEKATSSTVLAATATKTTEASVFSMGTTTSSSTTAATNRISEAAIQGFVARFLSIAQDESKKYGIPTSIILAQGILQTQAGENPLAEKGNNFFKLRASGTWKGKTYRAKTGVYRAYSTAWAGFRDHSTFITSGRFKHLGLIGSKNYVAWAAGLQAGGFDTDKDYAKQLIAVIEAEGLAQYDR